MKKIYFIGIGGIGVSGLARYYKSLGYDVYGSDKNTSELIESLKSEGMHITLGESPESIDISFEKVIYSEAIPEGQVERLKSREIGIASLSYPQAVGEVTSPLDLISIAGTHGKSTTTSMISLILLSSGKSFSSIVGTLLTEFGGKNFFQRKTSSDENYFVLESCEYRESFLNYKPLIGIVTNIEADHLDYYKNVDNYISAFEKFISGIKPGGYALINKEETLSTKLTEKRDDITYIEVYKDNYVWGGEIYEYPQIYLQIPGDHILFDAKIAYIVGKICKIEESIIIKALESYKGAWRRMEIVGKTQNGNTLMSDYGHHPTEIELTTKALKQKYPNNKLYCVFQPHQYSRTLELLEDFKGCFSHCDSLVIPDIYESRDSEENKEKISTVSLLEEIKHPNKVFGDGMENTLKLIENYDKTNPDSSIILLLGAGNIDDLRYKIKIS